MMTDEQPVSLECVQRGLRGNQLFADPRLTLRVVHRDCPAIRGRVVAWSNMETDTCSVEVDIDGITEPIVIERRYLLEYYDESE